MRSDSCRSATRQAGFTLIELMIAVVVIGILAAVAVPNYISLRKKSVRSSCIANQRNIAQGATHYCLENGISDANLNVTVLQSGGYISRACSECPASNVEDMDDYTVRIVDNRVTEVRCTVSAAEHAWTAP